MDTPQPPARAFVRDTLPWLVAAGALALYLATLSHWVTLASLPVVAQFTGWDWWNPVPARPLFTLVTWPLRWLPASAQIIGLNVFTAVCSAFALALLARSVALLPHDRTRDQRQRERSEHALLGLPTNWLPPLLAVLLCGLQLTFWENATAATGEALDLLLFAYCVRCVLEFRVTQKECWLAKLALVYGLAVPGNWAMIACFPGFLTALVWILGRRFFQRRLFVRLLLCGLAGLSLYLVAPLLQLASGQADAGFWPLLRQDLATQKLWLLSFPRSRTLLLGLTSLVPVLLLGIRWPTNVGDASPAGVALTNFMFRVVHLLFLVVCGWVAFDPVFSPRALGYGLAFLPFYYLGALAVGYYSGWLLLVCAGAPGRMRERPAPILRAVNRALLTALWLALVVAPVLLARQNFPRVRAQNGPALRQFAAATARALPPAAIVLSDTPARLQLLAATQHGQAATYLLLDTRWLPRLSYHRRLAAHYPGRWPAPPPEAPAQTVLPPTVIAQQLMELARTNALLYLQPTYGQVPQEALYLQPHGPVLRALAYAPGAITPPPLAPVDFAANEAFWSGSNSPTAALPSLDGPVLARWQSQALNHWGVELQRMGRMTEAGARFVQARALNTNPVAAINLAVNQALRAGQPLASLGAQPANLLTAQRSWETLLTTHGPVDEPELCFQLAQAYKQAGLRRQAAIELLRTQTLNPAHLPARLLLAETFLEVQMPGPALEVVRGIRATPALAAPTNDPPLVRLEALALAQQTNFSGAEKLLLAARQRHAQDPVALETLFQLYLQTRQLTNALSAVEQHLQLAPDNQRALLNHGAICLELKAYAASVASLDRLVKLNPNHTPAVINRGQALVGAGRLDEAQRDFEAVLQRQPSMPQGHLGLAEVALLRKQNGEALRHFEAGLLRVPAGTPQAAYVAQKIKDLKSAKP